MTAAHTDTTHDCSDDYCVGIDSQGNYRMSGGRGRLVANADHTINDVRGWFERSKPGQYREDYRAVLRFMRREAGVPDARPVHRDEENPPVDTAGSTLDVLARAIGDPGSVLPRAEGESVTRWAARAVAYVTAPAACSMTRTDPFDFAQCETHDTTFPLGEKCKFDGREPWEVYADEADEQRRRAVMAEHRLDVAFEGVTAAFERVPDGDDLRSLGSVAAAQGHKLSAAALIALGYLADGRRPRE